MILPNLGWKPNENGPNKNSHPITVDNVMRLLYMFICIRLLRGAGGVYVPGQISNRVISCFEE